MQSPLTIQAQGLNEEMADSVSLGGLFNILILCIFKVHLQDTLVSFSLLLLYALKPEGFVYDLEQLPRQEKVLIVSTGIY